MSDEHARMAMAVVSTHMQAIERELEVYGITVTPSTVETVLPNGGKVETFYGHVPCGEKHPCESPMDLPELVYAARTHSQSATMGQYEPEYISDRIRWLESEIAALPRDGVQDGLIVLQGCLASLRQSLALTTATDICNGACVEDDDIDAADWWKNGSPE